MPYAGPAVSSLRRRRRPGTGAHSRHDLGKFLRSRLRGSSPQNFETVTLIGVRLYALAVIEHATGRIRISAPPRTRPPPG